jgi:hypothetical protein
MSSADAGIALHWQTAIARSAQIYGYDLDASYTYRQIACPVAPDHLLLAYEAHSSNGALSRFTAVVPRATEPAERQLVSAQIVPILRSGMTPFVAAASNPHSIDVFNAAVPAGSAIPAETEAGRQPMLLRGLCYLAMIGEEPAALPSLSTDPAIASAPPPTLQYLERGRIEEIISVRNTLATYRIWSLLFSREGRLLSATCRERPTANTPPTLDAGMLSLPSTSAAIASPQPAVAAETRTPPVLPPTAHPSVEATLPAPASSVPNRAEPVSVAGPSPAFSPGTSTAPGPDLPLPASRFIPEPPPPASRFVPETALPPPPHQPR